MTQHACDKVVLRRSSRRGEAVSRNNFSCEVREWHHVCKNFGGGNCPVCPFLVAALGQSDSTRNNIQPNKKQKPEITNENTGKSSQSECERCFEIYVVIFTYIFRWSG